MEKGACQQTAGVWEAEMHVSQKPECDIGHLAPDGYNTSCDNRSYRIQNFPQESTVLILVLKINRYIADARPL